MGVQHISISPQVEELLQTIHFCWSFFLIIMGYLWYKTWNKTTGVLRENLLAPWIPGAHRLDRRSSPCTISTQKPPTGSRISKPLQMSRVTELWYNLVTWGLRGNAGCTSLLVKKLKKNYILFLCVIYNSDVFSFEFYMWSLWIW